jgi:hypothetical protein
MAFRTGGSRSSRVIARIFSTHNSDYASLTWEWIIRSDGQVCYRLRQVGGSRERNPWQPQSRLYGANLHAFAADTASAKTWLAGLALERGHHVDGYPDPGSGTDDRRGQRLPADAKQGCHLPATHGSATSPAGANIA